MTTHTLRIGVLMGGKSIEREVSFNSGRTICDHLDTQRYIVIPLFQTETGTLYILPQHFLHRGKISDFSGRLEMEAQKITWDKLNGLIDFMYLAIHGRYGEDGTVQGMLEILGIPYLGSKILGSAIGMNKTVQKSILTSYGSDTPRGITISAHELEQENFSLNTVMQKLDSASISFPLIVKPVHEGSSYGVTVVRSADQLMAGLYSASTIDARRKQSVIIEEQLSGMEFVCVSLEKIHSNDGIITRSWFSLPVTEVVIEDASDFFDYEQKYMPGRALKITPARCSKDDQQRIIQTCEQAARILQFCTISRIDGFLTTDGRVVIIDPNSLTGMSPSTFLFNQAAEYGMSHTDLINFLIENELKAYGLINDHTWQPSPKDEDMNSLQQQKIRIAVLFGGDSNEREVSLESGRNICYKLSPQKYDVLPIFVNDNMELFHLSQKLLIKNTTRAITQLVTPEIQIQWSDLPTLCDFVFIGLHGGKGENGAVQGALEMLDMPYNGPGVLASALCIDKFKANNFLHSHGFQVPHSTLLRREEWLSIQPEKKESFLQNYTTEHKLLFPLIIKPYDDGCSVMVTRADNVMDACVHLDTYFSSSKKAAMIEECIIGTELTVGVIGNTTPTALPPSMAVTQAGVLSMEEKFLPGAGENQTPAPLSSSAHILVKETLERVFKTIGCEGYSRIDCFYQDEQQSPTGYQRIVILEINTLPALTPATCLFHQAAELGIKPMDFIDKLIDLGFERHYQQHQNMTHIVAQQGALQFDQGDAQHKSDADDSSPLMVSPVLHKEAKSKESAKGNATDEDNLTMSLF